MYQINIKHFYMIEYIEDEKIMEIEVDLREPIVQIGLNCITTWKSPYNEEILSDNLKNKIAENVKKYLEVKKGMICEIV